MKTQTNVAYIFLIVGILNVVFLLDTIFSDPKIDYYIFSIKTSKYINMMYYIIISLILFITGFLILYKNLNKNK